MEIKPKKSLGQNFLIDKNVVSKIINSTNIKNLNIIEIGPGTGNLTIEILKKKPKSLILIEKDKKLCEVLRHKLQKNTNIKIINDDFLKINFEKILVKDSIIFGNLPYNISTQILIKLIKLTKWPPVYHKLVLMFQKEVAERITAKHNTSKYGRLTVISNWRLDVINNFNISKNCFYPKPKVDSSVLIFKPKFSKLYKINNILNLEKITQVFFSNKRKMINKSLINLFGKKDNIHEKFKIKLTDRPSNLKPDDYYRMTEYYEEKTNS